MNKLYINTKQFTYTFVDKYKNAFLFKKNQYIDFKNELDKAEFILFEENGTYFKYLSLVKCKIYLHVNRYDDYFEFDTNSEYQKLEIEDKRDFFIKTILE